MMAPMSPAAVFLLLRDIGALVSEAGGLYDRIMARNPADRSCRYLFDH
jgi:hypothetical protein